MASKKTRVRRSVQAKNIIARGSGQGSRWAQGAATAEVSSRLSKLEYVLGVGYGAMEDADEKMTGEAGLIVFVDRTRMEDAGELAKLLADGFGGHPVLIRPPRTTFAAYHAFLTKNGIDRPERFDCLPDPFWLDADKIHQMIQRRTHRDSARGPLDPATAVFGEIFVIEDDGSLVTDPGTMTESVDYQAIFVKFRQQFGDHYHFAYVHHDVASGLNPGGGVSPTIFNDITGINHYKGAPYDGRAGWNTTRLQSYQAVRSFQMRRMLHETAHRWLAYANHREGGATNTNLHEDLITTNPGQGIFHWGNWYDDDNSCMDYDYFDWVDAAGGYQMDGLTSGAAAVDEFRYTPVDLYLMGLMGTGEVPGFRYLENPQDPDADGTFTATLHALTIANITAEHGARNPSADNSQRVFHQAYILLTRDLPGAGDSTTGLVQQFDQWRRDFELRFREATLGRAFIDTRLLHGNFGNLYIRDNAADDGTTTTTGRTWDSPDIWVRQTDDNSTTHEDTDRTQDNYLRARVWNSSAASYDDVTVRFYIGNHAENLPGTDFEYPEDWRLDRFLGEQTISVPAGGSAVAKVTWHQADIPPATGWHPCLLVEVLPMQVTPDTLHGRTVNRKLAQKNITIFGPPGDPGDGAEFRFTIGRPRKRRKAHTLVIERVAAIPGLRVALAPEATDLVLVPGQSLATPPDLPAEPPQVLRPAQPAHPHGDCESRLFIPGGCWFGVSLGDDCWTTVRFTADTVLKLGAGLTRRGAKLVPLLRDGVVYQALPSWYRTVVRVPQFERGSQTGFQIVRANIGVDLAVNPEPHGHVHLRFMEYGTDNRLVGGVEYVMNLG